MFEKGSEKETLYLSYKTQAQDLELRYHKKLITEEQLRHQIEALRKDFDNFCFRVNHMFNIEGVCDNATDNDAAFGLNVRS